MRTIVSEFRQLDFFKAWVDKHHRLLHIDPPRKLALALDALMVASPDTLAKIGLVFTDLSAEKHGDECFAGAKQEVRIGTRGQRFVVYGHTHLATQVALSAGPLTADAYFNSGTFRRRVLQTEDKQGYFSTEAISYLCFFREDEVSTWRAAGDRAHGPGYASWMGLRSH
jgi:hypothetical protein